MASTPLSLLTIVLNLSCMWLLWHFPREVQFTVLCAGACKYGFLNWKLVSHVGTERGSSSPFLELPDYSHQLLASKQVISSYVSFSQQSLHWLINFSKLINSLTETAWKLSLILTSKFLTEESDLEFLPFLWNMWNLALVATGFRLLRRNEVFFLSKSWK